MAHDLHELWEVDLTSPLAAGLVAWYPLGNDLANRALYGGGLLTPFGNPAVLGGLRGTSHDFDYTDDYLTIPQSVMEAATADNALTISALVWNFSLTTDHAVVGQWGPFVPDRCFLLWMDTGGTDGYCFIVQDGSGTTITSTSAGGVIQRQWQVATATWDGTAAKVYVDGVEKASATGARTLRAITRDGAIGSENSSGSHRDHYGRMQDVRLWNRALHPSEVALLAQQDLTFGALRRQVTTGGYFFVSAATGVAGTASQDFAWDQTASGGPVVSGTATTTAAWDQTATGTVTDGITGTATQTFSWDQTAIGGPVVSGAASQDIAWDQTAVGSVGNVAYGTATTTVAWDQTATGTIPTVSTGAATTTVAWDQTATGGVIVSGAASQDFAWDQAGTATDGAYLSATTSPWDITGIPSAGLRTLDKASASLQDVVNLIGTIIYDFVNGWDGSAYTITGGSVDTTLDCDNDGANQIFDVIYTLIDRNPGASFATDDFTTSNRTIDYTMDCTATTAAEAADILASLLAALDAVPHHDETFNITQTLDNPLAVTTADALELSI